MPSTACDPTERRVYEGEEMSTTYRMFTSICLAAALVATISTANTATAKPTRLQLTGLETFTADSGAPCSPAPHCAPAQSAQALTKIF